MESDAMEALCRLCVEGAGDVVSIEGGVGDRINSCLPVKVDSSDDLPHNICKPCLLKVDTFYEFANTCKESERRLIRMIRGETATATSSITKPTYVKQEEVDVAAAIGKTEVTEAEEESKSYLFQQRFVEEEESASLQAPSRSEDDDDDDDDEEELPPPPKRAKRTAALKAAIALDQNSDDDLDDDMGDAHTKTEDQTDDSDDNFLVMPSTSGACAENSDQPGPSTVAPSAAAAKSSGSASAAADPVEAPFVFACDLCDKPFVTARKLRKHSITHDQSRPFACDSCPKRFKRKYDLTVHVRGVHATKEDPREGIRCSVCAKTLKSKSSYAVHMRRHLGEFKEKCVECDRGFVTRQEYLNHVGSKHGGSGHVCEVCGRGCYDKAALQAHVIRHSADYATNPSHRCPRCPKTFLREKYLRTHLLRIHSSDGPRRFICDVCGKDLRSKISLRDHKLAHLGLKPLSCADCGRNFGLRSTLRSHMRTHTGERPHKCEVCGKRFAQSGALKVHKLYHTGERPHKCGICAMGFVTRSLVGKHVRRQHGGV